MSVLYVVYKCLTGQRSAVFENIDTVPLELHIVTDLINSLPGNSFVNTVQHATVKVAVFSVYPTDAPIDRLDSDHVICVYCRSVSVPRLYK
jgi:hypothetical protein